jgi:CBS domain-containing membrane protein
MGPGVRFPNLAPFLLPRDALRLPSVGGGAKLAASLHRTATAGGEMAKRRGVAAAERVRKNRVEARRAHDAHEHAVLRAAIQRYGFHLWLADRLGSLGDALYSFGACLVAMTVSGLAAYLFRQPFLFPSLGPTAFLIFRTPMAGTASPRNTLIGHGAAIAVGYGTLALFGLRGAPNVLQVGVSPARIGAATIAVALTSALLILFRSLHPPAGATTLIVSLGLLDTIRAMMMMALGVVILTVTGWVINRALGVPVPRWAPPIKRG